VMMSMNRPPALWFSAANWSRVMWIDLICDFAGSAAPSKLSTRIRASPPAISSSWRRISSGSSDSASICSRVSARPNVSVFRSAAAAASRATVTSCSTFCSGRTMTCRLSRPVAHVAQAAAWNPGTRHGPRSGRASGPQSSPGPGRTSGLVRWQRPSSRPRSR
jgi:hypothetical protein